MKYIDSFTLASEDEEVSYVLSFPPKLEMACYSDTVYPFKVFPSKGLHKMNFEQITIICGGNGSGKSSLLNIIAQYLGVARRSPFNYTPYFEDYLQFCSAELTFGKNVPQGSRIITSDDVFDYLLDIRAVNSGIDRKRDELFEEYSDASGRSLGYRMSSLDDYDELKRRNEARRTTKSKYVSRRLPKNLSGLSNGESGFTYFTQEIRDNALYLLDEPENSLSAELQEKLAAFISDSARFYNCQFIISTHSPFILAMRDAICYDLDSHPARRCRWTELENIQRWRKFFREHDEEFQ